WSARLRSARSGRAASAWRIGPSQPSQRSSRSGSDVGHDPSAASAAPATAGLAPPPAIQLPAIGPPAGLGATLAARVQPAAVTGLPACRVRTGLEVWSSAMAAD